MRPLRQIALPALLVIAVMLVPLGATAQLAVQMADAFGEIATRMGTTLADVVGSPVKRVEAPPPGGGTPAPKAAPPAPAPKPVPKPVPSGPPPVAPVPSPTAPVRPPAPAPSTPSPTGPSTAHNEFLIMPGQGVGRIHVGMTITEVTAILGGPKATIRNATTGTSYAWFDYAALQNTLEFHLRVQGGGSACPPGCPDEGRSVDGGGLMVLTTQTGQVTGIRTYYAPQYVTAEGLRIGMREDQVRSALGAPANIEVVAEIG